MYIQGKYVSGSEGSGIVSEIRNKVFGYSRNTFEQFFDLDCSELTEEMAVHALAIREEKVVGCGTLYYNGENFVLDHIGVMAEERKQGYGDFLVRMLLDRAFRSGGREVTVYCREEMISFFEKIGFQKQKKRDDLCKLSIRQDFLCKECINMK